MVPLGFFTVLFVYLTTSHIWMVIPTSVTIGILGTVLAFQECTISNNELESNESSISTRSTSVDSLAALSLDVPQAVTPHNASPIPLRPQRVQIQPEDQSLDQKEVQRGIENLARRSSDHEIITVSENLTEFPVLVFCFDKIAIDTKEEVILPNVPSIFDHGPVVETKGLRYDSNNFRLLRPFWKKNRFVKSSVTPQQY
ncbi:unnamed protein product [Oikopleura dioica]|uniref:Uncharacterized protein n=1 Tax=Oikopleura dioica TaxID=34765 RepID=E4WWE9_OIKDI|nr:unnamed protein product [Oikopleura dioica]